MHGSWIERSNVEHGASGFTKAKTKQACVRFEIAMSIVHTQCRVWNDIHFTRLLRDFVISYFMQMYCNVATTCNRQQPTTTQTHKTQQCFLFALGIRHQALGLGFGAWCLGIGYWCKVYSVRKTKIPIEDWGWKLSRAVCIIIKPWRYEGWALSAAFDTISNHVSVVSIIGSWHLQAGGL